MLQSFFDPVEYSAKTVSKNAPTVLMTDIFRNYKGYFNRVAANYKMSTYYIQGSPRPEVLANTLYNNPQLYWVLLMANDVFDPFHGWIKSQQACYESIAQEYPDPEDQIAYHINIKGEQFWNVVQSTSRPNEWYDKGDKAQKFPQYVGVLSPVTIYEAAILDNEKLRQIKIINPPDIENFISDLIREMERAL